MLFCILNSESPNITSIRSFLVMSHPMVNVIIINNKIMFGLVSSAIKYM